MSNTFTNLLYHLVFSTKNRQDLIQPGCRDELYSYHRRLTYFALKGMDLGSIPVLALKRQAL